MTARQWGRAAGVPLVLVLLYALNVVHWVVFYHGGDISFQMVIWRPVPPEQWYPTDWEKERDYYTVLRDALEQGRLPYFMNLEYQGTRRFLGLPETNLAPDVLLLPWVPLGRLLLIHTLWLSTLGYVGCLLIRRRYRLGLVPFTLLWLLFGFNGFITAHLSVGHSMWNGYFLLSFAVLYILELIEEPARARPPLKLALVLAGMMLVGAFHIVIWCWILLALLVAFNPRLWKPGALALGFSGWLSLFRLLPAAVTFWGMSDRMFYSGYPTLSEVFDGLVNLHDAFYPLETYGLTFGRILGSAESPHGMQWWEYDLYIGWLGLAAVVYFGIVRRLRGPASECGRFAELDAPLLTMAFLSVNYFYAFIANLPLPLFNAEGVSSRFLILPVLVLVVLAAVQMQRMLEQGPWPAVLWVLLIGGVVQTGFALADHSYAWRIPFLPDGGESPRYQLVKIVTIAPEWWYSGSIFGSLAASGVGLAAWLVVFRRGKPRPAPEGVPS